MFRILTVAMVEEISRLSDFAFSPVVPSNRKGTCKCTSSYVFIPLEYNVLLQVHRTTNLTLSLVLPDKLTNVIFNFEVNEKVGNYNYEEPVGNYKAGEPSLQMSYWVTKNNPSIN